MISTDSPPDLYCSKGKLSCTAALRFTKITNDIIYKTKHTLSFSKLQGSFSTYTPLTEKYKQKLFGYKSFYLFSFLCAKTYSRHCVLRKYHCINKFYKLSHFVLFCTWRKIFLSKGLLLEKLVFNIRVLFRIKSCPLHRKKSRFLKYT